MNEDTRIPASQCYFQAEVEVRERRNDEDRSTPFSAIARTGDVLSHPFWGRVVHDLAGMRVKPRIPIDWNHSDTVVGYANRFNTESGDLEINGALTPTKYDQTQRAQQIIDQAEQGVPFEMSISFPGDLELEEIADGEQVTVNQRQLSGPLTVIRSWPLRAVAITPMGQDAHTALQFSEEQTVNVTYLNRSNDMSEQAIAIEAEVDDKLNEAVDKSADDTVEADAVDTEETAQEETKKDWRDLSVAQEFMTMFGRTQGALYFADGMTLEEATRMELERLQADNATLAAKFAELQKRFNAISDSEEEPTGFSEAGKLESNVLTEVPAPRATQVPE